MSTERRLVAREGEGTNAYEENRMAFLMSIYLLYDTHLRKSFCRWRVGLAGRPGVDGGGGGVEVAVCWVLGAGCCIHCTYSQQVMEGR